MGEKSITFYISASVFEIECRRNIANKAEDACLELKLTKLKAPWEFSSGSQLIQRKELNIAKGTTDPGVDCFNQSSYFAFSGYSA